MTEQPRDWDKELANIDRVLAKQSGPAPPAMPGRPAATPPAPVRGRSVALTWFWVSLGLALALALPLWPYEKTCGMRLIFFLGATGVTGLVGVLAAHASWAHRRGFAHVLSLLIIAWAGGLAAREVLPRVGYAKQSSTWGCSAEPVAPRPGPGPAPAPAPAPAP